MSKYDQYGITKFKILW